MTPVISPWVFYIMSVADDVDFVTSGIFFVTIVGALMFLIWNWVDAYDFDDFKDNLKAIKPIMITLVIASLVGIATPSGETITKMIIAQNVTYERVEAVGDTVETVYNDIMALFDDNATEGESE